MATTLPTPPPNPTVSEQILDPLTTTLSTIDSTDDAELRVPTTSETVTDLPILSSSESTDNWNSGCCHSGDCVSNHFDGNCCCSTQETPWEKTTVAASTTANQAYGLNTHHNKEVEESNVYNYPEVDLENITIETKQNDAYATNTDNIIITEGNQAHGTNIDMRRKSSLCYRHHYRRESGIRYKHYH